MRLFFIAISTFCIVFALNDIRVELHQQNTTLGRIAVALER